MLAPNRLLNLQRRNPKGVVIYLQLLRELVGIRGWNDFATHPDHSAFCEAMLGLNQLRNANALSLPTLCASLAFARLLHTPDLSQKLCHVLEDALPDPQCQRLLLSLPLASVRDLRWLANQCDSTTLRLLVEED